MKKNILTIVVFMFLSVLTFDKLFAQCDECQKALEKDYLRDNSTTWQHLNSLAIMDKETFDEYKKSSSAGGGASIGLPGIISATISKSNNYNEFIQHRDKLFQLYSYNKTTMEAKNELKIVTNPIAYSEWSKCMNLCYNNETATSKAYGYIEKADSSTILVKVKYKGNMTSLDFLTCNIVCDSGTILNQFGRNAGTYVSIIHFTLKKDQEVAFTIKRTLPARTVIISINSNAGVIFSDFLKFNSKSEPICPKGDLIQERSTGMADHWGGTNSSINSGNNQSTNDKDKIRIIAPCYGVYNVVASGSYRNTSYTEVDVFLSIYVNGRQVVCERIAQRCNNFGKDLIKGGISHYNIELHEGDDVELRFGNSGSSAEISQGFIYGAPGDFITLTLLKCL